jgi:hypothetical protein
MRKFTVMLLAALLIGGLAIVGLAGCGSSTGKVSSTGTSPSPVSRPTEATSVPSHVPTEAEVGVPVYPGARLNENESMSFTDKNGNKTYSVARLWSTDPVPKVTDWYVSQLSGKDQFKQIAAQTTAAGTATLLTYYENGKYKMVTVGPGEIEMKGKTVIAVGGGTPPQ